MSRIGKEPIAIPEKVEIKIQGVNVSIKGPNGQMAMDMNKLVKVEVKDKVITVNPIDESKEARSQWGTARTLVSNMVTGVTKGFTKSLEFNGVGYKAAVNGTTLTLNLGYSHPIDYKLPTGITAKVTKNVIDLTGFDKELVGFVAAKVRSFRPPEPYKGKGLKYTTETIIRKAGKAGAKK
ncbi:MAG: 50S ribosomal protein L6 [Bdellovibrio sp. CG12_big_fil_rev_8_21_14_0_65_39_13]|nr:MAG: 50S ribosomal protein L6 [Bdellovibrio sp. CG22_combo_CG10-13_8_21_14_all_39_27]PIQ62641.1 MAG: 50S ribosomal protein L6 [Bdellovibrio sp. CG12_big_fil_rev_8_21_14_0_65_39_13]PIR36996.1 MAG: 50S ribosomal protein L6 [Bdellovibrio sp. CG11_big_fil_rev_8_21_14_0_20_39_38]PJB54613.1 MAG: 50S ribosomal protein L6 [Bdellovibrio sp. CG_4_9_14_3_um_filter_39_7]